jgi:hypothetical protein
VAHDRQQLEVQLAHALHPSDAPDRFSLELYFFIPRAVGVTGDNYPKDEFYADLTTFLRVDLPDVTLEELAHGSHSLPQALDAHLAAVQRGEVPSQPLAVAIKLFGHAFTEAVREGATALLAGLEVLPQRGPQHLWTYLDEVDRFAERARAALVALRRAQHACEPLARAAPTVSQVFRYTDEYCSLYLDGALSVLAEATRRLPALFDGSGFVGRLQHTLIRHARREASYREARGFLNFEGGDGPNAEYFAYRQSFLKKAVQQALYVDTRRLATDTFIRNAAGAVAAGLAATWALVAQLPSRLSNLSPAAQTLLFGLPVVAYIAKDRIKELTREWLSRTVRNYDLSSEIPAGSLADAGLGALAGRVQERVGFRTLTELPAEVMAMRVANRTVRGAEVGSEHVLLYRRGLELRTVKHAPLPPGMGLRQIIRLNLRHFLTRLDEPQQDESHYCKDERRFVRRALPKVYHINLIAQVVSGDTATVRQRWRVVINKEGMVRLDTVATRTK